MTSKNFTGDPTVTVVGMRLDGSTTSELGVVFVPKMMLAVQVALARLTVMPVVPHCQPDGHAVGDGEMLAMPRATHRSSSPVAALLSTKMSRLSVASSSRTRGYGAVVLVLMVMLL